MYLLYPFVFLDSCPFCLRKVRDEKFKCFVLLSDDNFYCMHKECRKKAHYTELGEDFALSYEEYVEENKETILRTLKRQLELYGAYSDKLKGLFSCYKNCLAFLYPDGRKVRYFDYHGKEHYKWVGKENQPQQPFIPFAFSWVETKSFKTDVLLVTLSEFEALALLVQGFPAVALKTIENFEESLCGAIKYLDKSHFDRIAFALPNDAHFNERLEIIKKTVNNFVKHNLIFYLKPEFYKSRFNASSLELKNGKFIFNEDNLYFGLVQIDKNNPSGDNPSGNNPSGNNPSENASTTMKPDNANKEISKTSGFKAIPAGEIEKIDPKKIKGLKTGIKSIDMATLGLQFGTLTIIAGRGGAGKSTFALNLLRMFSRQGYKSLYWTGEESYSQIASSLHRIFAGEAVQKYFTEDGFEYYDADYKGKDINLISVASVVDSPLDTPEALRKLKLYILETNTKVVVIDNLGRTVSGKNDYFQEQRRVINTLHSIALQTSCVIIIIHHFKKGSANESGDAIKGVSEIRDWASYVMLLNTEEETDAYGGIKTITWLKLEKNRSHATGGARVNQRLYFDRKSLRLYESEEDLHANSPSDEKNTGNTRLQVLPVSEEEKTDEKSSDSDKTGDNDGNSQNGDSHPSFPAFYPISDKLSLTDVNYPLFSEICQSDFILPTDLKFAHISSKKEFDWILSKISPLTPIAFDTETTSIERDRKLICASLAFREENSKYIIAVCLSGEALSAFNEWLLLKPSNPILGFNIGFDLLSLAYQFKSNHYKYLNFLDVQILASLHLPPENIGASYISLDHYSLHFLKLKKLKLSNIFVSNKKTFIGLNETALKNDAFIYYSCEDAYATLKLYETLAPKSQPHLYQLLQAETDSLRLLIDAELNGFPFSVEKLESFKLDLEQKVKEAYNALHEDEIIKEIMKENNLPEFNPRSILHKKFLQDKLNLQSFSLSADKRKEFIHIPTIYLIDDLLNKEVFLTNCLNRFEKYVKNNRIYSSFTPCGAVSGRVISRNPNIQNVAHHPVYQIRECFIPDKGRRLIIADYSQIELRILALRASAKKLLHAFDAGEDIHRYMASILFNKPIEEISDKERKKAKGITFGILYGMGATKLAGFLGISMDEAIEIIRQYRKKFIEIDRYRQDTRAFAMKKGFVETILGRKLQVSLTKENKIENWVSAFNFTIQGSAADLLKLALSNLSEYIFESGNKARFLHTIHDEVVIEVEESLVPQFLEDLKTLLEFKIKGVDAFGRIIPNLEHKFKVDIRVAENWAKQE